MTSQEKALLKKYKEVQHKAEMFDIIRKQKLIRIRRNLAKHGAKMSTRELKLHTGKQILKPIEKAMKTYERTQKRIKREELKRHKKIAKADLGRQRISIAKLEEYEAHMRMMNEVDRQIDRELARLEKVESASRKMYTEAEAIAEAVEQRLTGEFNGTPHMADKARHLYNATIAKFNEEPEMRMLYLLRWKEILGLRSLMRLIDQYFYGSDPWQTYRVGDDLYSSPAFNGDIQNVDAWDEILQAAFDPLEDWKMNSINEAFITYLEDDMY